MSGVDVLKVMNRLRQEWRDESVIVGRLDSSDAIDSVFSAVAELIEEHQLLLDAVKRLPATDGRVIGLISLIGRSEAALSRVRGAE